MVLSTAMPFLANLMRNIIIIYTVEHSMQLNLKTFSHPQTKFLSDPAHLSHFNILNFCFFASIVYNTYTLKCGKSITKIHWECRGFVSLWMEPVCQIINKSCKLLGHGVKQICVWCIWYKNKLVLQSRFTLHRLWHYY